MKEQKKEYFETSLELFLKEFKFTNEMVRGNTSDEIREAFIGIVAYLFTPIENQSCFTRFCKPPETLKMRAGCPEPSFTCFCMVDGLPRRSLTTLIAYIKSPVGKGFESIC